MISGWKTSQISELLYEQDVQFVKNASWTDDQLTIRTLLFAVNSIENFDISVP